MVQYSVALFDSTSQVMRGERVLGQAGVRVKMIPTPRQISSDCGACIRILREDIETARRTIQAGLVEIESIQEI